MEYNKRCAVVKKETRRANKDGWNRNIVNIQHNVRDRQDYAYRIVEPLNKDETLPIPEL
jgi:hypothetical protein